MGVASTCRWIAGAFIVFNYPHGPKTQPAHAPVSKRSAAAHEELIEYEVFAAERLATKQPAWLENRPGWIEEVLATLAWSWKGTGPPPIELRRASTG